MVDAVVGVTAPGTAAAPRPGTSVLARYALLLLIPVLAAGFAADLEFYPLFGERYGAAVRECAASVGAVATTDLLEVSQDFFRCKAVADRGRIGFALAGGAVALLIGVGLVRLLPRRLYRRAGRMRPAGQRWQLAAAEAIRSMGGRVVPLVVLASDCREPFTVRVAGGVQIVLPRGVVTLPDDQARAVVRHECAHVVAGDLGRVWLTRGVWWATPLILAVPVVDQAVRAALRPDHTVAELLSTEFWIVYGTRCALLLAVLWVVARGVLRGREHEADLLSAADDTGRVGLRALLAQRRASGRSSGFEVVRRFTALHPSFDRRLTVVDGGTVNLAARAVEGVSFGALGGCTMLLVSHFVRPLAAGAEHPGLTALLAALVPGVLLATARGAVRRTGAGGAALTRGSAPHRVATTLALPAGAVIGLNLAPTGVVAPWDVIGYSSWLWVLTAFLVAGASVVGAAFDRPPDPSTGRGARWWAGVGTAALYVGAVAVPEQIAAAVQMADAVDLEPGVLALLVAAAVPSWALLTGQAVVVFAEVRRRGRARWTAAAVALGVAAVVAAARLTTAAPITRDTGEEQVLADILPAAGAGVASALAVALVVRAGHGLATAAGWTATALVAVTLALRLPYTAGEALRFHLLPALSLSAIGLLVVAVLVPVGHPNRPGS
ncbi:M48 family metalloprotease [Actinosynnema sp. NPDC053489]|uniref:M48 family metalloprotease n=1 Tax=Actinosynnema sp. NPDC053489 TaxID=3363916 RepID=UPI0037CA7362